MSTESTPDATTHDLAGTREGPQPVTDWSDVGREVWEYLTGRGAEVTYHLDDLEVQVPRDTGADAPRATWRFNGQVRVTANDDPS